MVNKTKVLLSTFGPLHLIKSAEFLSPLVDITVIQGWIPTWWNNWMIKPVSRIIGYDLGRTIRKRTPDCLDNRNYGLGLADFIANASRFFVKSPNIQDFWLSAANHIYGKMSMKYIHNADVFHVRSGSGRGGAIQKAKELGMKVVVDHSIAHPHFMEISLSDEFKRNGTFFNLSEKTRFWKDVLDDCHEADVIVVNSYFVQRTFVENGFPSEKVAVAYLGVREDFWGLKQNYQMHENKFKVLFTGGFGFRKGAEYILKAMQALESMGINTELIVVGNYNEALQLLNKYPVKGIRLIGFIPQDDLKEYLSTSDVYLFPSLCEGCASSGMEAMASGLPVIATEESGLPISDGQNGLLVPSKDVQAITEALLTLMKDEGLRKSLGQNAAHLIKEQFSWEMYAKKILSIYSN